MARLSLALSPLLRRQLRPRLAVAFLAGLGTAHILVRTATYGAAVSMDSTTFLSTALNCLAGEGWRDFAGRPLATWPPLFPLLLAAGGWVGIEPLATGRWVNAVAFGLTILAAGGWLCSNLRSRWLVLAATGAIATSLPLSHWASHLLTEPLFVLFTLLALIQLASFLHRGGRTPLLWGAVFTALAALTRYPGVVLIGVGVLVLLVRRTPPLAARLKDAGVFGVVASIPLAGVLTRNWATSGTLTGGRYGWSLTGGRGGSGQSLSDSLNQVVDVFRGWVIPLNAPDGLGYLLWATTGLVMGVVVLSGLGGSKGKGRTASLSFGVGPALPFGGFAVGYLAFMVAVVPFAIYRGIDSRFLLPLYVPLLLAGVLLLDRFLSIEAAGWRVPVRYVVASLVLLASLVHIGFSAQRNLTLTAQAYVAGYEGRTYNAAHWQHSEILNYIRDNRIEGRIYSNAVHFAWFWDRDAAPGKYRKKFSRRLSGLVRQMMRWTEDGTAAYIVWVENVSVQDYDDLDLRVLPGAETVAELADGFVLRLTAAEPFDAKRHRARKQRYVEQLLEQAGERVVRSDWDVYRNGRKLTYLKKPCAAADVQAKFVLHVVPTDPADLPVHRKRFGYDNLGFYFDRRGRRVADQCIAIVELPDYAMDRIRVGQWVSERNRTLWDAEFSPGR